MNGRFALFNPTLTLMLNCLLLLQKCLISLMFVLSLKTMKMMTGFNMASWALCSFISKTFKVHAPNTPFRFPETIKNRLSYSDQRLIKYSIAKFDFSLITVFPKNVISVRWLNDFVLGRGKQKNVTHWIEGGGLTLRWHVLHNTASSVLHGRSQLRKTFY